MALPPTNPSGLVRDAEDLNKVINGDGTTNRAGDSLPSIKSIIGAVEARRDSAILAIDADVDAVGSARGSALSSITSSTNQVTSARNSALNTISQAENDVQGELSDAVERIEQDGRDAAASAGWFVVGEFADGFEFTARNQVGRDADGEFWSYNGAELPFTVSAGTVPSEPEYTNRGDAALRSELSGIGGHRLVSNQLSANAYGAPAKLVNVQTGVDAPTVIDYFDGFFWGYRNNNLERSADGTQWEIYTTSLGFNPARLIPTSDGEVLSISTQGNAVRKSSGWGTESITFSIVLNNPSQTGAPFLRWGFDGQGSKFIATHYGSGTSNWADSRYVWISTDAGDTWDVVWDTQVQFPGLSEESHLHAACYDPWDDRFYFGEGHGAPQGIYYSDDNGQNWTRIQNDGGLAPAPTVMVATDFGIVIGTDSSPNGIAFLARSQDPDDVGVEFISTISKYGARGGVLGFADRGMRDPDTGIVYVGFNSAFQSNPTTIFAVGSGGAGIVLESVGGDDSVTINRYSNVVCAKGKLLATHNIDGRIVADVPPYTQQVKPFDTGNLMPEVSRTRQLALAVGRSAVATGINSLSIGGQTVEHQDRVVISYRGDHGSGPNSVVLGNTASAETNSTALGYGSNAANSALAVGYQSSAAVNNTSLGSGASALGTQTTAIGRNATASIAFSVAIGDGANAAGSYALAIGYQAEAGESSIAMGGQNSIGSTSVGVGRAATAGGSSASTGHSAEAGNFSVSFGRRAKSQNNCVAVGYQASALLQSAIAIGDSSFAGSAADVVIGRDAKSLSSVLAQTAVGRSAESEASGGVAVGNLAKVASGHDDSVAIGRNTETQRRNSLCVGNRDIESTRTAGRLILRSPDGTPWAITVDNSGVISAASI